MIHFTLAILIPILISLLIGCLPQELGEPVDYGPKVSGAEISDALVAAQGGGFNPEKTKIGTYVHFNTSQVLAGGAIANLLSATGQTVIDLQENDDQIRYSIVENKIQLRDGKEERLSREYNICLQKTDVGCLNSSSYDREASTRAPESPAQKALARLFKQTSLSPTMDVSPMAVARSMMNEVRAQAQSVSFHRLLTSSFVGSPPSAVSKESGCLGLPGCRMTYNKVSFDQVIWGDKGGERINFQFLVSPDAPSLSGYNMSPLFDFYPGLMSSCVTLLVPVGEGDSKTLLTECQDVVNFRFESAAN